jgi:SAM-dependent methyltransferase
MNTPPTAEPDPVPLDRRTRLHLGSGRKYDPTAVNVDLTPDTSPDVVHDLDVRPWPFPNDRFDSVAMYDVLEHLDDTLGTLEEIHRVCRDGATVHIIVPHFSSNGAYTDPTHRRFFAARTFDYLTEGHPLSFYTRVRYRREEVRIVFRPSLLNRIVWRLANRWVEGYENSWAWMFPAWFVSATLRVVKAGTAGAPPK